ncbi:MAG: peptidoglycan DD-metalloendopeptidase family protein [Bacteroidaceae bacterium]|nr:peptidoglycan DD-metalloendopeptidase family protein [Bacteroidaceae bacterium]
MKRLCLLLCMLLCLAPLGAQTNKRIKDLQNRQGQLRKQIEETQTLLNSTKKDVGSQLNTLNALTGQIDERRRYIDTLTSDMAQIDAEMNLVEAQLSRLQTDLLAQKDDYVASLRYLQRHGSIQQKLMFIFSAGSLAQTLRRLRYVREYATYQKAQGLAMQQQQQDISAKRKELEEVRASKTDLLQQREAERRVLETQQREQRALVNELQKTQKGLQDEIRKKQAEANKLNAEIDKLVAAEIEKARKQAEEEARREAEAKKQAEAVKRTETKTVTKTAAKPATTKTATSAKSTTALAPASLASTDKALSANFEQNRGRLPAPITTSYIVVSRFGQYNVQGMKNVTLDNKGIDLQGKPGAKARAVFNGKVAAIFQLNGLFNVLVRHGQYISVYCNLSSTSVKQGDDVTTRQELGTVFTDTSNDNRTVLHFQLRKERDKLNPERWLKL